MGIPKGGIAFFDSGIGGLTVLAECQKQILDYPFYYYGDNRHAPYGNLSRKTIERYVLRIFRRLKKYKPSAAVIACNTATAVCAEILRQKFSFPIIGAEPAVRLAAKKGGLIYILSTRATYESNRFRCLLERVQKEYPDVILKPYSCDGLAGAIEEGLPQGNEGYTSHFPEGRPNVVVLGCTHYVYIRKEIAAYYDCPILDGNDGIARRLKSCLQKTSDSNDHRRPLFRKNRGKISQAKGRIFFLGGQKNLNKRIYEQMFVLSGGKKGQKSQNL